MLSATGGSNMSGIERVLAALLLAGAVAGAAAFSFQAGNTENSQLSALPLTQPGTPDESSTVIHVAGLPAPAPLGPPAAFRPAIVAVRPTVRAAATPLRRLPIAHVAKAAPRPAPTPAAPEAPVAPAPALPPTPAPAPAPTPVADTAAPVATPAPTITTDHDNRGRRGRDNLEAKEEPVVRLTLSAGAPAAPAAPPAAVTITTDNSHGRHRG